MIVTVFNITYYFSVFLVLVDRISKHLEARQKYSATRRAFNSLLSVSKCGQTQSFVFHILR